MGLRNLIQSFVEKSLLQATVDRLLEKSILKTEFFIQLFLSASIATLGLIDNNMSIVIGAMVIAPLLTPLLSFSLGAISFKPKLFLFGLLAIILGSILGILTAAGLVYVMGHSEIPRQIVDIYTFHGYDFLIIALLSGMAASFASLNKDRSEQLIGVAIAAALVPPLAFAGIALGMQQYELFTKTITLYALNLLATSLGAMIVYASFLAKNRLDPAQIEEKKI